MVVWPERVSDTLGQVPQGRVTGKVSVFVVYLLEMIYVAQADADRVFAAGWSEQALHDAINIICMANFMTRMVLGHGGTAGHISAHFDVPRQGRALVPGGDGPAHGH